MRQIVKKYTGYSITDDVIDRMNDIAKARRDEASNDIIYGIINSIGELSASIFTLPESINAVLGEDWFLIYSINPCDITIDVWVARNNVSNKLMQTMEMYQTFKDIFLLSKNKTLIASMKHDTSYRFYRSLLDRGYLEEFYSETFLEPYTPNELVTLLLQKYGSLDEFFGGDEMDYDFDGDLKSYISHEIGFGVTEKFVKKYRKVSQ